ncbi:hypothetical protein MF4836_00995 [Pseudomonas sp. MF4836]|nr:hypothetical protein MF4836_00995 [Pseudomonas sp. MF4836]
MYFSLLLFQFIAQVFFRHPKNTKLLFCICEIFILMFIVIVIVRKRHRLLPHFKCHRNDGTSQPPYLQRRDQVSLRNNK